MTQEQERVLSRIQNLLNLADKSRNNSDEEAHAALLKAQELMAKYHIAMEEASEEEGTVVLVRCETKWNYSFRYPLAVRLAKNFRCRSWVAGGVIVAVGTPTDSAIFKEVFEFTYRHISKGASRAYNRAYQLGRPTKGVQNSYAGGFILGMEKALEEQCTALAVVVPDSVEEKYKEATAQAREVGMDTNNFNDAVALEGMRDGKQFIRKDLRVKY